MDREAILYKNREEIEYLLFLAIAFSWFNEPSWVAGSIHAGKTARIHIQKKCQTFPSDTPKSQPLSQFSLILFLDNPL
jgi:hypothetical protein